MMARIKGGRWRSSCQRLEDVSTRAGECGLFWCCLFIGSDCSPCLNSANKVFLFPSPLKKKTPPTCLDFFFSSLLRIFSISSVSGPRDFISTAVVALRRAKKLCAVSVFISFFFFTFLYRDLRRMRVRLRCVCAPSGIIGDSHQLHLERCPVPDAGVAYQPDTQMFKLATSESERLGLRA